MIKGRRTSPDTGVGPFGDGVASISDDDDPPEDGIGLLRWRGGGIRLGLDEDTCTLLSSGGKRNGFRWRMGCDIDFHLSGWYNGRFRRFRSIVDVFFVASVVLRYQTNRR